MADIESEKQSSRDVLSAAMASATPICVWMCMCMRERETIALQRDQFLPCSFNRALTQTHKLEAPMTAFSVGQQLLQRPWLHNDYDDSLICCLMLSRCTMTPSLESGLNRRSSLNRRARSNKLGE